MGEKKIRKYLSPDEFKENYVDWSYDTLMRRIKHDGFPAIKDGKGWLIPADEADLWFKKRKAANQ